MKRMTTRIAFLNLCLVFLWSTILDAQDIGKPLDIKFTAVDGREVDLSK